MPLYGKNFQRVKKMSLKEQWQKIKTNWLIILVVVLLVFGLLFWPRGPGAAVNTGEDYMAEKMAAAPSMARGVSGMYGGDFAPEVSDRKITKSASLSLETENREFKAAEEKLKVIIKASSSFLLNENVNQYEEELEGYHQGWYQIKVETKRYDAVIKQLKEIAEVKSFNENNQDITGVYKNLKTELELEKSRLLRYQQMYKEAQNMADKITLNDRIFEQERTIKYLEEALANKDLQVDYSTIYVNLAEKQSSYAGMALVKFSQLIKKVVGSFNSLLGLLFWALPYLAAAIIVWLIIRWRKRKKN